MDIVLILKFIFLGVIEGFTEFLPLSSTAHIIFFGKLFAISALPEFKIFLTVAQGCAMLAVLFLFRGRIFALLKDKKKLLNVVLITLPVIIFGLIFYKQIKTLQESKFVIAFGILLGAVLLFFGQTKNGQKALNAKNSFLTGFFQILALIPGVSRSGSVIGGGMLLGVKKSELVETSFLVALPVIFGATLLDLLKTPIAVSQTGAIALALGSFASFFVAFYSAKWFINFVLKSNFNIFLLYRCAFLILILLFL